MEFGQAALDKLEKVHGITFLSRASERPRGANRIKIECHCKLHPKRVAPFGSWSYANTMLAHISYIGRYCSIASGVRVTGDEHPVDWMSTSPVLYNMAGRPKPNRDGLPEFEATPKPVSIGNDVWIGQDVLLRSGIKIGDGAIVASGSVVTKDVAPYHIVGGAPARVIRKRFDDDVIAGLQELRWWRFGPDTFKGLDVTNPRAIVANFPKYAEPIPEVRRTIMGWLNTD